jgi:hypothetical protein
MKHEHQTLAELRKNFFAAATVLALVLMAAAIYEMVWR